MSTGLLVLTAFHTAVSFVAIIAGLLVVKGLIFSAGRQLWTLLFLVSAAITTVTGFFFPFNGLTPALVLGVISIPPISVAILARYRYRLAGKWRGSYVINSMIVLYFNLFVLVVQAFQKVPSLHALAPTQTEPAFQITQLVTLILSIVAGVFAYRNYQTRRLTDELVSGYVSPRLEAE